MEDISVNAADIPWERVEGVPARLRRKVLRHGPGPAVESLRVLHEDVDSRAGKLARLHSSRLVCRRGCHDCCVDGLSVFEIEADHIRTNYARLLANAKPHAAGACAFLAKDGSCRIYSHRPYVCRTQGLPLRWMEEGPAGERVEYRDICPLNDDGSPLEQLAPEQCWTLGPTESRLAALQTRDGHGLTRTPLRELFRR